jgi:hypothetical protein
MNPIDILIIDRQFDRYASNLLQIFDFLTHIKHCSFLATMCCWLQLD